jgi:CotH kinase protein
VVGCLAFAILGSPASSVAADEAAWLFNPDAVVEIDLGGLSDAEIAELNAEPDEYVRGSYELKVDGVPKGPALGDVGIRLKGGLGSFKELPAKAGFKVKFDKYVKDQLFFGLERLTLNNMVQDPSMIHEALTYELFDALDLPASRTGYAFVRLNGEVYGTYLNIETLDEHWLPRWFGSTEHLYEADEPGVDVDPGGAGDFEVDQGNDEDLADLEALIAAANDGVGDWSDGMAGIADLEQMTRMWAVERYVGHWDGYAGVDDTFRPNNYYLHSDDSGLFTMLPWGTDQTWELDVEFDEEAGGLLFNECFADASCKALYEAALGEIHSTVRELEFSRHAAERAELLAPCQALETEPGREYTAAEIEAGVEEAREFATDRPEELREWLELPFEGSPTEDPPASLGAEPCSQQPEPEPKPDLDPSSGQLGAAALVSLPSISKATPGKLWIGRSRLRGTRIVTRLRLPAAGRAEQRVSARLGKRRSTVCAAVKAPAFAGFVKLSCRLPEWVLRRLQGEPLGLRVSVSFTPHGGDTDKDVRFLTAPKRPAGSA